MKRILSVILCLAVFLSSMVIGVISTASAEGAGAVVTPATTVTATGAPESAGTLDGVTAKAGELKADEDGNYYLTGDITVDSADDLAAVNTALDAGKTFDGKGYTITTSVPLFDTIKGGTLKNFTVKGEIKVTNEMVPGTSVGVIANYITGAEGAIVVVNFENIKVEARLEFVGNKSNPELGGFVGRNTHGKVTFTNCVSAGYIGSKTISTKVGGFIDYTAALGTETHFVNCTSSARCEVGCHFGGFLSENNTNAVSSFTNCIADLDAQATVAGTGYSGGIIGYAKGQITITNSKVTGTYSSADVTGSKPFGGVTGQMKDNTGDGLVIDGLYIDATFDSICSTFGGVVAQFQANGRIDAKNVTFAGKSTILEGQQSGGIIGLINSANAKKVTLENCVFDGELGIVYTNAAGPAESFIGTMIGRVNKAVTEGIYLTNCASVADATYTFPYANNGALCYAMIARIDAGGHKEVVFDGCYNTGDVTVDAYHANTSGRNMNVAALVGLYHLTNPLKVTNCYNTGDFSVYRYGYLGAAAGTGAGMNVAGLVACHNQNAPMTITDSYNTGNMTGGTRYGTPYLGGIVAFMNATSSEVKIENCYNTGDLSATVWDGNGRTYDASKVIASGNKNNGAETDKPGDASGRPAVGGIVGQSNGKTDKLFINNVLNTGDLTSTHELNQQARVGGIIAALYKSATITSAFNAGNVALNTTFAQQPAGGIVGLSAETDTFVVENCVNIGDVTSTSTYYAAGIVGTIGSNKGLIKDSANFGTITGATKAASIATLILGEIDETFECGVTVENVYSVADDNADAFMTYQEVTGEGEAAVTVVKDRDLGVTAKAVAELPAYCTPDNTKSVNAKAYITLVFANIDADLASAYVADEFKGDKVATVDRLNNLIQPDVIFGVTFDKDLYDAIEAIVGDENVKVEGIVTLSKYVEKIGEFTHEAFDEYYEANAKALADKNVTKLYMDATRTETNLGSGDLVDGDYFVNIRLIEANAGTVATTYTARAFIQIGDAYIYSSIIADAE